MISTDEGRTACDLLAVRPFWVPGFAKNAVRNHAQVSAKCCVGSNGSGCKRTRQMPFRENQCLQPKCRLALEWHILAGILIVCLLNCYEIKTLYSMMMAFAASAKDVLWLCDRCQTALPPAIDGASVSGRGQCRLAFMAHALRKIVPNARCSTVFRVTFSVVFHAKTGSAQVAVFSDFSLHPWVGPVCEPSVFRPV